MTTTSSERILRQIESEREYYYVNDFNDLPEETVFDRTAVITRQPFTEDVNRNPLPITTVNRNNFNAIQSLPLTGLALLLDITEITIEQTVELDDLLSVVESESRYFVKTDGQVLYGGLESSSVVQRLFCGSSRRFVFRLFDKSKQEALYLVRRLAATTPLCGCYLQRLDIFEPPCDYIGFVQQKFNLRESEFSVGGSDLGVIYKVTGPFKYCWNCFSKKEIIFTVRDIEGTIVGQINQEWDQNILNFKLTVKFPTRASARERAILMSCGILLEYMFFQEPSRTCFSCFR